MLSGECAIASVARPLAHDPCAYVWEPCVRPCAHAPPLPLRLAPKRTREHTGEQLPCAVRVYYTGMELTSV